MGHVELSYAFNSLQDTVQAALYRRIYERLGNMIFQTGDGMSMETAYIVTGYNFFLEPNYLQNLSLNIKSI